MTNPTTTKVICCPTTAQYPHPVSAIPMATATALIWAVTSVMTRLEKRIPRLRSARSWVFAPDTMTSPESTTAIPTTRSS
jgi:hypothetical protein